MKTVIGLGVLMLLAQTAVAETAEVSAVKKAVFSGISGISDSMQIGVGELLVQKQWRANNAGKLMDAKCGVVPHKTEVLDLNADGVKEVMLLVGNECSSGKIGQTVYLFTQAADGSVQRQLGFSASGYKVLKAKTEGAWPDLLFLGTGECQPIWRHQPGSGRYNFNHLYEAKPQACMVGQMKIHDGK